MLFERDDEDPDEAPPNPTNDDGTASSSDTVSYSGKHLIVMTVKIPNSYFLLISIFFIGENNDEPSNALMAPNSPKLQIENNVDVPIEIDDSDDESSAAHSGIQTAKDTNRMESNASLESSCRGVKQANGPKLNNKSGAKVDVKRKRSNTSNDSDSLDEDAGPSTSPNAPKQLKRNNAGVFECNICAHVSRTKYSLAQHQLIHGGISTKRFKCDRCDYASRQKHNLTRHQQMHADQKLMGIERDANGTYKCTKCTRQFKKWALLRRHFTKAHNNNQRLFNCCRCMRPFAQKIEKEKHERWCQFRRYECYLCKKYVAADVVNMRKHMQTHSDAKNPFE